MASQDTHIARERQATGTDLASREDRAARGHKAVRRQQIWTLAIISVGLFMVVLDNLIVTVALPSIRRDMNASIQSLEWITNAYVLAYAVLLLLGSALGDIVGRRRMFIIGISLFTVGSAASALAPGLNDLIAARALQGLGGAFVTPLTLTLLADAFPVQQRGLALGIWSAVSGSAIALGPLVGGAAIQLASWHWIFWINVPVGVLVVAAAATRLRESFGASHRIDLGGLVLASGGLFGLTFGLIRSQVLGWSSGTVLVSLSAGIVLLVAFVLVERRVSEPLLPLGFFRSRAFSVANLLLLAMYFGMFGSIFFLSQFLQNVLGNSALQAGTKMLVWTGATMVVSPLAGVAANRFGSRLLMIAGIALQAVALGWMAEIAATHVAFTGMVGPFLLAGTGMGLVFAPSSSAVLAAVREDQAGQASGATNAIRELGGVLGIALLATVFTHHGGYTSPESFVTGLRPTIWVGAAVLAVSVLVALALPFKPRRATAVEQTEGDAAASRATAPAPARALGSNS
jgi:EmrB/QacA subfamily drug resistance transporter